MTTYVYNAVGAISNVTHGNGVTTTNSLDLLNRLRSVEHRKSHNSLLARYAYTRLNDRKISRVVESNAGGQVSQTDYTYDELGRLKQEACNGVAICTDDTIDYKLDLFGNRLEKKTMAENGDVSLVNSARNLRDWHLTKLMRMRT